MRRLIHCAHCILTCLDVAKICMLKERDPNTRRQTSFPELLSNNQCCIWQHPEKRDKLKTHVMLRCFTEK